VCCSVLQCVAVLCSVLQCGAVYRYHPCSADVNLHCIAVRIAVCVAVCCSVLQCVAVCCSVLQCVAMCCNVLQRGALYRFHSCSGDINLQVIAMCVAV